MEILLTTILHRPYVFTFLAAFFALGTLFFGWKRTGLWLVIGYAIAWTSEFSAIRTGFPYGWYFYIYENMSGELMIGGVPFWDSLSYTFMIFASFSTATFILNMNPIGTKSSRWLPLAALTATLTTLLDVITDPLAHLGNEWFLGKIYYYPTPGWYFDVPIANFVGWFFVAFCVAAVFLLVSRRLFGETPLFQNNKFAILFPLFYSSIALFNIIITIYIHHYFLAICSSLVLLPVVILCWRHRPSSATY